MEIVIIVAIWSVIVKRGVEDILHAARGGTPHRYKAARKAGSSGAWGRYWRALSDDTAADLLERHRVRRERRSGAPARPDKPRGAATRFFAGIAQDGRRAVRRRWDAGWDGLDERRRARTTRPRPGQDTVPGTVVPNRDEQQDEQRDGGQDETQDRPQDEAGPEPRIVQDEDGTTDLQFGDDPTDPTGTKQCPECRGAIVIDGTVCPSCLARQEQRNQHHDNQEEQIVPPDPSQLDCRNCTQDRHWHDQHCMIRDDDPWIGATGQDDNQTTPTQEGDAQGSPDTQEGPTTMTATTTEVVGLDSAIRFCEDSARAYRAQIQAIEQTQAALDAGGVTGPTAAAFAQAMEQSSQAAEAMDVAAAELLSHKQVQEAYNANAGAGTREFVTAGQ